MKGHLCPGGQAEPPGPGSLGVGQKEYTGNGVKVCT